MDLSGLDFQVQKEAFLKELLDLTIKSLEAGTLDVAGSEEASRFVMERLNRANDIFELKAHAEDLCKYWECYKPALIFFEKEEAQQDDRTKLEQTKDELGQIINNQD